MVGAGHSLGGALATLAAYDIQAACDCPEKLDLSCYTFGAPRTGNHAFAHEFNEKARPCSCPASVWSDAADTSAVGSANHPVQGM